MSTSAQTVSEIAKLYSDADRLKGAGRYTEAEKLYERTITIAKKALGSEHVSVGTLMVSLGDLHHDRGRDFEAEHFYLRSLFIFEKALGRQHPYIGRLLVKLDKLYRPQGRDVKPTLLAKRNHSIKKEGLD
jgi:tetratricopeptide (TPR) repeat protein